jgi:arylsulfatase B
MNKAVRNLFLCLLWLATAGFNPAHAEPLVDSRMSGSWFDPTHNGEGFLLEVLESNRAVVYWFTYDETGAQRWFTSVGEVNNGSAVFDELMVASGPVFGDEFNPDAVEYSDIGELSIEWIDCSHATATYTVNGVAGNQTLDRLSTLAGLDCEAPISTPSPMSGSWFDQTHNGEGLVIETLPDGRVLIFWFSYDGDGKQAWFYGFGEQDGTHISISNMYITSGGRFGPDFDPEQVQQESWGSLLVELGCDYGKFDYASELPVFGSGKQTLTRLTSPGNPECEPTRPPNILLVIADDLGLDASSQYDISAEYPVTPTLDQLADQGLIFENAWSNPTCSPTRAGMLTGKFSTGTGVLIPGDVLSEDETSLQSYIHQHLPGKYADAVIGKWHLGPQPGGQDHPAELGISHFAGITGGGVDDYENWPLTINGQRSIETKYVTSKLVDLAVEWTSQQEDPWFLWLAFNAPHAPFHLPPTELHNRELSGSDADIAANPLPYYLAAIEAMDTEISRLLESFDDQTRENTIVIFLGDNGTPGQVAQFPYSRGKAKGSLYQGGINVPFFISGPGVTRAGERESALVNTTDLFSTIAAIAGVNVDQVNDSISFEHMLSEEQASERIAQYSEQSTDSGEEWTISDGIYKLIESSTGTQQLYQLSIDPFEDTDLVETGTAPADVVEDLQFLADQIR